MFTPEDKQRVRDATDLVSLVSETVQLHPRGRDLWGCCPFHHEKTPSFHVVPETGFWKCFSCHKGGDCFTFVMERDHVEFPEAVKILADRAGIELHDSYERDARSSSGSKKNRLYDVMEEAIRFYHAQLTRVHSSGSDAARAYLAGRGFGSDISRDWELGYAPGSGQLSRHLTEAGFTAQEMIDANLSVKKHGSIQDRFFNRVMFPIRDERGRAVALGGRVLDDSKPKYLNTSETPIFHKGSTLFAFDRAKSHITAQAEALVMEGYTDVIASHEAGFRHAVAPLGTAFGAKHVKMLARYLSAPGDRRARGRIVCIFDGDDAGLRAAERTLSFVSVTPVPLCCVVLPDKQDPAEFLASEGPDALRALLEQAVPLARFVIDRHLATHRIETPEDRVLALDDVVRAMGPLKGTPLASEYVDYVAGCLLADPSTVRTALAAVRWMPPHDLLDDTSETNDSLLTIASDAPQASLSYAQQGQDATQPTDDRNQSRRVLPEDARAMRIEREVLSVIVSDLPTARTLAPRIADIMWTDPIHEAIAWAVLATPEDSTPSEVLMAAESVCPEAARILADGMIFLDEEEPADRALRILLDDLEIRSIRRRIESGRAQLRTVLAGDPEGYEKTFRELADLQRRLLELEGRVRLTS